MLQMTTDIARNIKTNDISYKGKAGDTVYKSCKPLRSARNVAKSSAQKSEITFAGTGELLPKAEVAISVMIDCKDHVITLCNQTTSPISLQDMLVEAINGNPTTGVHSQLLGFTARKVGTTKVEITGIDGKKFTINYSGFAITVDGVARPPVPTTILIVSAFCSGMLKFGFVVVRAQNTPEYNHPPGLIRNPEEILSLPTGSVNEEPIGFVMREESNGNLNLFSGLDSCCDTECEPEGVGCGDCYHVLELCCTNQQTWIPIEAFPAGSIVPVDLKDATVHYRSAPSGTNIELGIPVIKLSSTPDPTVKPVSNKAFHASVVEISKGITNGYQQARVKITPIRN